MTQTLPTAAEALHSASSSLSARLLEGWPPIYKRELTTLLREAGAHRASLTRSWQALRAVVGQEADLSKPSALVQWLHFASRLELYEALRRAAGVAALRHLLEVLLEHLPGAGPVCYGQVTRLMRKRGNVSLLVMAQALGEVRRAITGSREVDSLPDGLPFWLAGATRAEALQALRRAALLPPLS